MIREEIENSYNERHGTRSRADGTWLRDIGYDIAIDFALEMVRRHNEELQEKFDKRAYTIGVNWILRTIREAKP